MAKIWVRFLFVLAVAIVGHPPAEAKDFGAGIILFGPTGFSLNYFLDKGNSIDGALGWGGNHQKIYIHSTYLWHRPNLLDLKRFKLDVHYGVGGRLVAWDYDNPRDRREFDRDDETFLGVRGAAGVGYTFPDPRIEIFGEISLTMDVIPETDADLDLGLGARYYF